MPRTEEEREAVSEWLTANRINPSSVPIDSPFTVQDDGAKKVIHYEQFVPTAGGQKQVAPEDGTKAWTRDATAPCKADPPAWLHIDETTGGSL